ncbi:SLC13 family permease [Arthrobacter sp. JUb115]|uniref:GntP family permease n=1 Tax=Arthrobacter sp. JUb115 TaxID=2485108 RepID=UPI00105E097C|nr:SLC13 family permease [Arthrobacter sp. JUb115]TDU29639.1 H+/gluconate symporter-like permease [Arthrobacter sp. JUb115]
MSDIAILINTAVAVLAAVVLIVRFKVNPVIALVIGSLYLGLSTGLGVTKTIETITQGFGDIMVEVGLLVAFGVLMGSILNETGAIRRLVEHLLNTFGPKRLPYTMALAVSTALQTIFLDVLLVIAAPLARRMAPKIGKHGTARIATAMAIAGEVGIVLMVPGVGAVALAGMLEVPLGKMLIFGLLVVVPTVLISVAIMSFFFDRGFWKAESDEQLLAQDEPTPGTRKLENREGTGQDAARTGNAGTATAATAVQTGQRREAPLFLLFLPLLVSLLLIASGALAEILGYEASWIQLVGNPVVALLIGLVGTIAVARYTIGQKAIDRGVASGFRESGQILLLTGVGGSLAATVSTAGLGDIMGQFFSASTVAPLVVVWGIAALLHIAVGSVTLSGITAASLLAPIAPSLGIDPVLIALAAGSGALFMVHVTSNTFWLLQSLFGQTVRGALKTVSVGVSVASIVALGMVMILNIFI